ncbi:MAG: alpha/beta hydrolase [Opitutaceae bacterium]|nr:alpha/beta hydrolase [Cytophagales bacterium]
MTYQRIIYISIFISLFFCSCKKKRESDEIKPAIPAEVIQPRSDSTTSSYKPTRLIKADSLYVVQSALIKVSAKFDPTLAVFQTQSKYDVKVYRVEYKTEYDGKIITASGIVALPFGENKAWPTLSYHHGTVFADSDAPTNNKNDQFVIASLASAGYVIAAPDYIGFGSSTGITHPYYVAKYSSTTPRDLLIATQELLAQKHIASNGKLFLAGYSQGGNVTMAVSKSIELNPLPGYNLTATAVGAGGYNMEGIFADITSRTEYSSPNYIAYIIQSYRKTYHLKDSLNYYFKEPYASRVDKLIDGKTDGSVISNNLTSHFDSLIRPEFVNAVKNGTDINFSTALKENNLHNWKPTLPLKIYHSDADEVVPYSDSEFTYKTMLDLGSTSVSFVQIQGKSHGAGSIPMIADVINWFNSF